MSEEVKLDAESTETPNERRMATIMKVDTSALLESITAIEKAISDYKKPGDIPKWAQALTARLELVERVANRTPRGADPGATSSGPGGLTSTPSLVSQGQEEKLLAKMREDVKHHIGASTLSLESKISTMTLELDRLQKVREPAVCPAHALVVCVLAPLC